MVPRQFIDLGPPSDEVSSEERKMVQSGSPPSLLEKSSSRQNEKRVLVREESPETESNCWRSPNKVPKHHGSSSNCGGNGNGNGNSNVIEQSTAEATMRKARVSVRARVEAPMVKLINLHF